MLSLIVVANHRQLGECRPALATVITASEVSSCTFFVVAVEPVPALDDRAAAAAERRLERRCVSTCLGAVAPAASYVAEGCGASGLRSCGAGVFRLWARARGEHQVGVLETWDENLGRDIVFTRLWSINAGGLQACGWWARGAV